MFTWWKYLYFFKMQDFYSYWMKTTGKHIFQKTPKLFYNYLLFTGNVNF